MPFMGPTEGHNRENVSRFQLEQEVGGRDDRCCGKCKHRKLSGPCRTGSEMEMDPRFDLRPWRRLGELEH